MGRLGRRDGEGGGAARPQPAADVGPTAAEVAAAEAAAARRKQEAEKFELRRQLDEAHGSEKSILHIPSMYDYQGRTYMDTPTDTDTILRLSLIHI